MNLIKNSILTGGLAVFCFLAISVLVTTLRASPSCAAEIADQPCDTGYWASMSNRAWMEAEREIIQNQNLIFKPDSVLEYTCFDSFVNHNAKNAGPLFVHTMYFGKKILPDTGQYSMVDALTNVVANSLKTSNDEDFADSFLADRAKHLDVERPDKKFTGEAGKTDYTCDIMANIWKAAKCINFIDNEAFQATDGFYPFKDIKQGAFSKYHDIAGYKSMEDPRQWPESMKCGKPDNPTWDLAIDDSENLDDKLYDFAVPLKSDFQDIRSRLAPNGCMSPIMTGITVKLSPGTGGGDYQDGVCTNPGCTFLKSGSCSADGAEPGG